MSDSRELILSRLETLLTTIPGMAAGYRNRVAIPPADLPAIVLLDGTERVFLSGQGRNRMPDKVGPSINIMEPQIFFVLRPKELKKAAEYGPELSLWRGRIIRAIYDDMELATLLTANGAIEYRGSETDFQSGRTNEGQLQLNFWFYYVFNPLTLPT
jgi:hypothetical protein